MIVYSGNKASFQKDAINGVLARRIDETFRSFGIPKESYAEYKSWENSLPQMGLVLSDPRIDNEVQVALEYQIPLTSKRVDFMVGGSDGKKDNVVIVELKQWESCTATSRENVVIAFTGGRDREVAHPSQQAYSYAKLIENFNEDVRTNGIGLIPCAYLHNYLEENRGQICHPHYGEALADAPVFLQEDGSKLQDFLVEYVCKPSNKKLFEIIENGKLKPSQSLQDTVGSILNGNDEFEMIDEQQVAYATILKLVENSIGSNDKHTIIVQGGPGTGKSVIAINLLAKIINNKYSCVYATKNSAPRYTFSEHLIKGKHTVGYLKGLFKSSGSFVDTPSNTFDCILTDAYGIIGLNSKDSTDKGFLKLSPILFSPQKRLMVNLRRKHAQNEDLSAKRSAACNFGSTVSDVVPSHLLQRQSAEHTPDVDLHRSTVRYPKDVSLACAA